MSIESFNGPASIQQFDTNEQITNFLYLIWLSRPDLQSVFNISTSDGQAAFRGWAKDSVKREYGVPAEFHNPGADLSNGKPRSFAPVAGLKRLIGRASLQQAGRPGATLIGYADGVLGMGEHVRMSAEVLSRTIVPFGVLNVDPGPYHRREGIRGNLPIVKGNRFRANVFHVNADQMLHAYCQLGPDFFRNRYNVGFWAWELAECPVNWFPVIDMVDEIWAPSRFIQEGFKRASSKTVTYMPLCVELPPFPERPRAYFGLPEGDCLFLYTFDFLSYLDRKNPYAAVAAFRQAFPLGTEPAGLVLKAMKGDPDSPKWQAMLEVIDDDPRIFLINEVMTREDVLALTSTCDCFVSLHRSEGFGRGPAEAMFLGKPVIVTAYSGNMDFTRPGASLLVDYELVPVEPGQYVFADGQVWAEADIGQAALHMRAVFERDPGIQRIAKRGKEVIRSEFSFAAIGRRMVDRLRQLHAI
jgi:glycosyltransferase involved in cell wall biosynthesis